MGALSLTNSKVKQRAGFGPLIPMVHHAPFPRIRAWREDSGGDGSAELVHLRTTIFGRQISPKDVAAIVIEPIQGEGGYFPAPAAFMQGLRELCDEHGILLVADEIQSGLGRTGTWWAIERMGVEPDIVATAKGLGSGMPIGAFIARDSVWTWPPGAHGSTFAGNPVCAAAALATLDVIEAEGIANATAMGARLRTGLQRVAAETDAVRDIRGAGLMLGVEFDSHEVAEAVQEAAFRRGLLTLECGESSLRFSPPLIVDEASVDASLRIFAEALDAAASAGYTKTFMWDIDTIDWKPAADGGPTAEQIASKVVGNAVNGSNVLFHLGGYETLDALRLIVPGLRDRGFTLTSLSDLLK